MKKLGRETQTRRLIGVSLVSTNWHSQLKCEIDVHRAVCGHGTFISISFGLPHDYRIHSKPLDRKSIRIKFAVHIEDMERSLDNV